MWAHQRLPVTKSISPSPLMSARQTAWVCESVVVDRVRLPAVGRLLVPPDAEPVGAGAQARRRRRRRRSRTTCMWAAVLAEVGLVEGPLRLARPRPGLPTSLRRSPRRRGRRRSRRPRPGRAQYLRLPGVCRRGERRAPARARTGPRPGAAKAIRRSGLSGLSGVGRVAADQFPAAVAVTSTQSGLSLLVTGTATCRFQAAVGCPGSRTSRSACPGCRPRSGRPGRRR